jgi:hypothetical protein
MVWLNDDLFRTMRTNREKEVAQLLLAKRAKTPAAIGPKPPMATSRQPGDGRDDAPLWPCAPGCCAEV